MALTFTTDDWYYTKDRLEKRLAEFRNITESPDKTYKEKLIATGKILLAKELLNMPNQVLLETLAAAKHQPQPKRVNK